MNDIKDFKKFKKEQAKVFKEEAENYTSNNQKAKPAMVEDPRFFNIKQDDTGEGKVTIRFLPATNRKVGSFVKILKHNTNRNGKYINVICPKTFDKKADCPICSYKNSIWGENEKLARTFLASPLYFTNILIVQDKVNPENEGKVFLIRFGNQIFKHIEECMKEEVDYLDFDNGRNFIFKIQKDKEGRNDYTLSRFSDAQTAICNGDEEEQLNVFKSIYDLEEFYDNSKVLPVEELQKKLDFFLEASANKPKTAEEKVKEKLEKADKNPTKPAADDDNDNLPFEKSNEKSSPKDEDDDIDYDKLLADD